MARATCQLPAGSPALVIARASPASAYASSSCFVSSLSSALSASEVPTLGCLSPSALRRIAIASSSSFPASAYSPASVRM